MKRFLSIILLLAMCLALLGACRDVSDEPDDTDQPGFDQEYATGVAHDEFFDMFIDELFAQWVTSDTITMQFFLADPEAVGIERPAPTYGAVMSPGLYLEEKANTIYIARNLGSVDYNLLREDQKVIYEIIERNVELSTILEEKEDFAYYTGYIRPVTGIQVQLPVLLAEFKFYTHGDVELYLDLLEETIDYFDRIIEFERERAARGFFLSDVNIDTVIEQIEAFSENRGNNLLITVFNDKIDALESVSEQQREELKKRNRELVLNNVLVAYDNLLEAMRSLKGVGGNPGGYALLPDGERFAHAMLKLGAGIDKTISEIESMVSRSKTTSLSRLRGILMSDSELTRRYSLGETGQIPYGTPEEYLLVLQEAITQDFPPIGETGYTVSVVHESLREHMSPAFYLMPAIDRYNENVIYINPSSGQEDNLSMFTVLAHEGYPGHLYETVYFRQQNPHPVRAMLVSTGYTEGWATYAEYMSYRYAGLDDLEAELMHEVSLYFLMLFAQIDIGVNLLGWNTGDVEKLLRDDLGIDDSETVDYYYNWVTGTPLNICMYAIGYIEIMELRSLAADAWGDDYSLYGFHEFMLDFGPAPFDIIGKRIGN